MQNYRTNTILWLALCALVVFAFLYAEHQGAGFLFLILAVTALKFTAIALQFMELRHAHLVWPAWLLALLLFYAVGILSFVGQ